MLLKRVGCIFVYLFVASLFVAGGECHAEAALLMEEPYGFFGTINPTGHNAVYFENICAETPTHVRRCKRGELGSVIARYEGVNGFDWVAIPLIPYLYAVNSATEVPSVVDKAQVVDMRDHYRDQNFEPFGLDHPGGSLYHNGWKQLIGVSYERRIYAFRFKTTLKQDDELIARLNSQPNVSHFRLLYRNCSDFAREVMNFYFPKTFRRSIFPDAGITTPKQVTYKLVRYARKHPEVELTVLEIPQIPGYRWRSHSAKNIAESFSTTAYAIPITFVNPYLAGVIFLDYLFRGRYNLVPRRPEVLSPHNLLALTAPSQDKQNSADAEPQVPGAAPQISSTTADGPIGAESDLTESLASQ